MPCGNLLCESGCLAVKVIEIGDWNMDANASIAVAHGLTLSKIKSVSVMVRNDADDAYYQLCGFDGATLPAYQTAIDATNINVTRKTSDTFDSTDFDSTSYNRGWVTIIYSLD